MSSYAEDSLAQYTRVRRIRELFDNLEGVYGELERDYKRVASENADLRELVRDMHKAFVHGNCYRWCEFEEPCNYISDGRCQWYDRMRELGVTE